MEGRGLWRYAADTVWCQTAASLTCADKAGSERGTGQDHPRTLAGLEAKSELQGSAENPLIREPRAQEAQSWATLESSDDWTFLILFGCLVSRLYSHALNKNRSPFDEP